MTSNIGANVIAELPSNLTGSEPAVQETLMEVVRGTLSPELLKCVILLILLGIILYTFILTSSLSFTISRIDETVVFNRLQRENMDSIAQIQLKEISKRLLEGQNMTLDVSDAALGCISDKGYDVRYGARPLKRVLNSTVLNPLSRLVLEGSVQEGDTVRVRTRGEVDLLIKSSPATSWISSNDADEGDRNDIVLLRNHDPKSDDADNEVDAWDDEEFLLEDGTHHHR